MRKQFSEILKIVGVIFLGSFILGGLVTFGARYIRFDQETSMFKIGNKTKIEGNLYVDGKVGIGTGITEPGAGLHISGKNIAGQAVPASILIKATPKSNLGPALQLWNDEETGGRRFIVLSTGKNNFGGTGLFQIADQTANQARLSIDANGKVGIGTTGPQSKLDVMGEWRGSQEGQTWSETPIARLRVADKAERGGARLQLERGTAGADEAGIAFGEYDKVSNFFIGHVYSGGGTTPNFHISKSAIWRDGQGKIKNVPMVTITPDGKFGIGTTDPRTKLHLEGGATQPPYITFNRTDESGGNKQWVMGASLYNPGHFVLAKIPDTFPTDFKSNSAYARFTVTPEGNVGIGTSNPDGWKLNVDGSLRANHKAFEIDHPTKPNKKLVHSCIEGPEIGVYYRGKGRLINGQARVELPEYFDALTRDNTTTILLTAKGKIPFLLSYDDFDEKSFVVYGSVEKGEFEWEVKAVRADVEPLQVERDK